MYDSFGVGSIESVGSLNSQAEQNIGLDGLSSDPMLQRHSLQENLMAMKGCPGCSFRRSCRYWDGSVQKQLELLLETSQCLGVFGYFIGQKLQRDESEGHTPGFVNDAHAATAQLLDDGDARWSGRSCD